MRVQVGEIGGCLAFEDYTGNAVSSKTHAITTERSGLSRGESSEIHDASLLEWNQRESTMRRGQYFGVTLGVG